MSWNPIKVDERSPLHPLMCAGAAIEEEICAGVKNATAGCCGQPDAIEVPPHPNDDIPLVCVAIGKFAEFIDAFLNVLGTALFATLLKTGTWLHNCLTCLTGEAPDYDNVSPAALEAAGPYKLNRSRLGQSYSAGDAISAEDLEKVYKIKLESILRLHMTMSIGKREMCIKMEQKLASTRSQAISWSPSCSITRAGSTAPTSLSNIK